MQMNLDISRQFGGRLKKTLAAFVPAVLVCLLAAGLAFAGEHAEPAGTMGWIQKSVHSAILLAGLIFIYVKYISGPLKKRVEGIENQLAEAKTAKEDAVKKLAEVEARLKNKDAELQSIVDVAAENGRKEKEHLIAEGERMSREIVENAKENIDAEISKAKEQIRREAALMAVEMAEKLVKDNITKEDQAKILEDYIAKVGG